VGVGYCLDLGQCWPAGFCRITACGHIRKLGNVPTKHPSSTIFILAVSF
jgi:hypothetical protein